MSLFSKVNDGERALVIDIGSASVGGAIVLFSKGKIPNILYTKRVPLAIGQKPSTETLLEKIYSYTDELVGEVLKQKPGKLHYCFTVFSAPWYVSRTKTIHIEKKEPVQVTKKFIDQVLIDEAKLFEKEMLAGTYGTVVGKELEIIEKNIIQTKINGYETAHPESHKARNIEISVFMSLVVKSILENVENLIHKSFHIQHISFHSFSLSICNSIRDIFPHEASFINADVAGEVTEFSYVHDGVLSETISFPCGRNTFIRKTADYFATTPEVARSFLKLYAEGTAEEKISGDIEKAIASSKAEWIMSMDQAIADLSKGMIPQKLFVTADSETASLFLGFIRERGVIAPLLLDDSILSPFITHKETNVDPFIALPSIHFNKLFHL